MDIFMEKIVRRRKNIIDIALISIITILATIISFFVFVFLGAELSPVIILGVGYLAYFLASKRNIEYEYAVTNGDIDIDIIFNQRKRKRLFSANCKDFEMVARKNSSQYTKQIQEIKKVKDFSSNNPLAEIWFIYWKHAGESEVVYFEPSNQMIESFRTYIPRKVFRD